MFLIYGFKLLAMGWLWLNVRKGILKAFDDH